MLFICYPNCTTCQKAKAWLDSQGIAYEMRNIKTHRPSEDELRRWQKLSGLPLHKFVNTSGQSYRALGGKVIFDGMSENEKLAAFGADGMLVKRPLLIDESFVLIGFKEDAWTRQLLQP